MNDRSPSRKKAAFDVTFLIGPTLQPIHAHKFVLANVSDVFDKMFYSDFGSEDQITVDDIDFETFNLMLDCIYGRDFDITTENMQMVLYAAEKYNLANLRKIGSSFIISVVKPDNVLTILNMVYQFNNIAVNKCCLAIIWDNPTYYFTRQTFLTLKANVIRCIVKQSCMNCSVYDLAKAIQAWMKHNDLVSTDNFEANIGMHFNLSMNDIWNKKCTSEIIYRYIHTFTERFELTENFSINCVNLYGIGLLLGHKDTKIVQEKITITFSANDKVLRTVTKTVQKDDPKNCCFVQDIFFEKFAVKLGAAEILRVEVHFCGNGNRATFHYHDRGGKKSFISHLIYAKIE